MTMDYNEMMMRYAPKQCKPTVVDTEKDFQSALKAEAKRQKKDVKQLTEQEREKALGQIGLCSLDLQVP